METSMIESRNSIETEVTQNNEYTNSLVLENEQLKMLNEKLYRRTLNQKRKILRLKKIIEENQAIQSDNIDDMAWEDVNDVLNEFKKEDLDSSKNDELTSSNEN